MYFNTRSVLRTEYRLFANAVRINQVCACLRVCVGAPHINLCVDGAKKKNSTFINVGSLDQFPAQPGNEPCDQKCSRGTASRARRRSAANYPLFGAHRAAPRGRARCRAAQKQVCQRHLPDPTVHRYRCPLRRLLAAGVRSSKRNQLLVMLVASWLTRIPAVGADIQHPASSGRCASWRWTASGYPPCRCRSRPTTWTYLTSSRSNSMPSAAGCLRFLGGENGRPRCWRGAGSRAIRL